MAGQRRAGVVLGYVNIVVKNVVNLIYTPMLLSYVGQGDYGVFQTANSFVFTLSLLSLGFSGAYVRFYTQRAAEGDEEGIRSLNGMYLVFYTAVSLVALSIGLFCSVNVGTVFSNSFTAEEIGLAGSLMAIMTVNVSITLFTTVFDSCVVVHERFLFQKTRQIATTLATPALALLLLGIGTGAVGVAVAQLAVNALLLLLNIRYAIVTLGMRFDVRHFDGQLFWGVATFSGWLLVNQLCELANQNVPNVVLGAQCGAVVVSVFAVSVLIRTMFASLSTAMSGVFVPLVNRIVAQSDDNDALCGIMTRVGRYQMLLLCWVYGGFAVVGRFFILRWAGDGFMDAYWMILVMVLPLLVPLSQNVGIEIQKAKNMHRARSIAYLAMALVAVVFTWILSPSMGYWAPAIAYTASIVLGNCLFMNWFYHFRVGLNMVAFWKRVSPVVLCMALSAAVCLAGAMFVPVDGWMQFALWGAVYTAVYGALVMVLVADADERALVALRFFKK